MPNEREILPYASPAVEHRHRTVMHFVAIAFGALLMLFGAFFFATAYANGGWPPVPTATMWQINELKLRLAACGCVLACPGFYYIRLGIRGERTPERAVAMSEQATIATSLWLAAVFVRLVVLHGARALRKKN